MIVWYIILLFTVVQAETGFQFPSFLHELSFDVKSKMHCISGNACNSSDNIQSIKCVNLEADNVLPDWRCTPNFKHEYNDIKLSDIMPFCIELNKTDPVYKHISYDCEISFSLNHDLDMKTANDTFTTTPHNSLIFFLWLLCGMFVLWIIIIAYSRYVHGHNWYVYNHDWITGWRNSPDIEHTNINNRSDHAYQSIPMSYTSRNELGKNGANSRSISKSDKDSIIINV